jgi:hypothetical protein
MPKVSEHLLFNLAEEKRSHSGTPAKVVPDDTVAG